MNIFNRNNENKLSSLGVGQIHLIKSWLDEMEITNYVINDDLTIDVNDCVYLDYKNLIEFPDYIQFNYIDGYFSCSSNNLISLKGCPKIINGSFSCCSNQLISLKGCPESVGEDFWCECNKKQFNMDEIEQYCVIKGLIFV